MAKILYLGDSRSLSTSAHRAHALERIGHSVTIEDPFKAFEKQLNSKLYGLIHYHSGYRLLQKEMLNWLKSIIRLKPSFDIIWVDSGQLFGPKCLEALKELNCPIVLYNVDDPTGKRDGHRFDSLIKAISHYDIMVVVRPETKQECESLGAKKVVQVLRSYDEIAHQPFSDLSEIPDVYRSEVAFIGTWMRHEKRDEFLLDLKNRGIPLSIWGERWNKSKYWDEIKPFYKGGALSGRNYVAAIQGAKICLGLLSKGNRDLHTQRSLEVPFAGGLFCAERTSEHCFMYKEGVEAVFWENSNECADICEKLLNDDVLREEIRTTGMKRVLALEVGNETICKRIIDELKIIK